MNPAELILRTRALLKSGKADVKAIAALFAEADGLLELQIAGAWLVRHLPHESVFEWLRAEDPVERRAAAMFVERLGAAGARFLRHLVKDSDGGVSHFASNAVERLGLTDVSPPDRAERKFLPRGTPTWDPTGWSAGSTRGMPQRLRKEGSWSGLPRSPWAKSADLLKAIGFRESDLWLTSRPAGARGSFYVEFKIPKRNGFRTLAAPRPRLKGAQRLLLDSFFNALPLHPAAHGFRPNRSIITNAKPHVGAGLVVKMDLQDFFPSVHYRRVEGLMWKLGHTREVARALARLTTYHSKLPNGRSVQPGVLPQGAPTSPVIANLISKGLDGRLTGLAKKWGAQYTRYADDLTFSFKERHPPKLERFLWWVNAICQQEGFIENASKRRLLRSGSRQSVTGLVVNEKVSVPRHVRRRFKAILHNVKKNGLAAEARGRKDFAQWFRGMAAYLAMVHPEQGKKWLTEVRAILKKESA
jgi:retron-type reverse transcriptase